MRLNPAPVRYRSTKPGQFSDEEAIDDPVLIFLTVGRFLGWRVSVQIGSEHENIVPVGNHTRREGVPPFHAVDDNRKSVCGALVPHIFTNDWDKALVKDRCEECLDLIESSTAG